jgi:hypothetical protein
MIIAPRRRSTWAAILFFASLTAAAAAQAPVTGLDKQLDRINLVISGSGALNHATSGANPLNQTTTDSSGNKIGCGLLPNPQPCETTYDKPGNTVGALIDIQYIKSPLIGLEFNVDYSRYVQNFTYYPLSPGSAPTQTPLGIQNDAVEYTLGWVFHTPKVFGIGTFASAGAGATDFVPTRGGGYQNLPQARATYYYNVGFEQQVLSPHFGLRASFRQAFFLAPDFEINYLRVLKHTSTVEPTIGFYLHF